MAEWSKAPDSRFYLTFMIGSLYREFWSSYEGVGSNPTSDSNFFALHWFDRVRPKTCLDTEFVIKCKQESFRPHPMCDICWAVSALQCCYFDWVAFLACLLHIWKVAWPSGLRRWFKAPVSSGAWVRIPPLPKTFFPKKGRKTKNFSGDTRIWTMDLSDCSRLLYHWAISPELDCCLHFVWGEEPVCAGVSCCVYEHTGRARRRR